MVRRWAYTRAKGGAPFSVQDYLPVYRFLQQGSRLSSPSRRLVVVSARTDFPAIRCTLMRYPRVEFGRHPPPLPFPGFRTCMVVQSSSVLGSYGISLSSAVRNRYQINSTIRGISCYILSFLRRLTTHSPRHDRDNSPSLILTKKSLFQAGAAAAGTATPAAATAAIPNNRSIRAT